uniref:Uncharacterized protein n=1 Tax=Rhodosorus marinus TaxID=101924 RepID=A0A7S0G577_9RHOD|mmetsp:Transcript_7547/g.11251  ORF Transcript_7547/g.11251 Transcript_7547/m.11251 type:complete len:126 (+) Transcript_7547:430-807(+)
MCNILFARELAKRLGTRSTICSSAIHPGDIVTEISKNMGKFLAFGHRYVIGPMLIKLEQGAWTQAYAAVHPDMEGVTGRLLWRVDETIPFEEKPFQRLEPDCQSRLWEICLDICSATEAEKAILP